MSKNPIISSLVILAFFFMACQNESSTSSEEAAYYQELHRPQFHFSPESAWMNDPNGMVYFQGEYHLFYQYYPHSNVWGPMHWGHAISKDLITWEHLPIALYPDELGMIFSGSAVVDWKNTSGFGDGNTPPMIAMFTYHNMNGERTGATDFQTQGIAYSLDKGRTWTKYAGNPVIPNLGVRDFRDPKVIWHEASQQWVMVLAAKDRIQIFNSKDLKSWELASEFEDKVANLGVWECPDLFPLSVEGSEQEKWVLIISHGDGGPSGGSCTRYLVGDFDGSTFKSDFPEDKVRWFDWGKDNYAGVTWSDVPEQDGRRIFIGWMSNWQYAKAVPTIQWRSAMTIPRTLSLRNTPEGLSLVAAPIKELEDLRSKTIQLDPQEIEGHALIQNLDPSQAEITLTFDLENSSSRSFGIELSNPAGDILRIHYDNDSDELIVDRVNSGITDFSTSFQGDLNYIPRPTGPNDMKWHLFLDKSSLELFVDDGLISVTDIFFPHEDFSAFKFFAFDGKAVLKEGTAYQLKGTW